MHISDTTLILRQGNQHKLTRYAPIPNGSPAGTQPKMLWRVGRESLHSNDPPAGEIVSSMRTSMAMQGMIGIIDQSMAGVHVFTEDGFFVDSAFLPGEFQRKSLFGRESRRVPHMTVSDQSSAPPPRVCKPRCGSLSRAC